MKNFLSLALLGLLSATAQADVIFSESFESEPGSTYTLATPFDDGSFDFFGRYAVPDTGNAARDDFANGWDGGFGIIGQDHDGQGGAATNSISIAGIDVSAAPVITVDMLVGALSSEPNFNNYEALDSDGIEIYAQIDGGGFGLIGAFAPNATGASDLYLDTDLDGVGDGPNLTVDLTRYSFLVSGTGTTIDLRIDMTSTSSFEPLAVDLVRVNAVPEPGSLSVLALAGITMLTRRRRK